MCPSEFYNSKWVRSTESDEEHTDEDNRDDCSISSEILHRPVPVPCEFIYLIAVSHDSNTHEDEDDSDENFHSKDIVTKLYQKLVFF